MISISWKNICSDDHCLFYRLVYRNTNISWCSFYAENQSNYPLKQAKTVIHIWVCFFCCMGRYQGGHHRNFLHYHIDTSKPFRHRILSQDMLEGLNSDTKHPGTCYKPHCSWTRGPRLIHFSFSCKVSLRLVQCINDILIICNSSNYTPNPRRCITEMGAYQVARYECH